MDKPSEISNWDYYSATFDFDGPNEARAYLRDHLGEPDLVKPERGYGSACVWHAPDTSKLLHMSWGGHNGGVHLQCSGYNCRDVVPLLRSAWPDHSVARADSAVDLGGGQALFNEWVPRVKRVGRARKWVTEVAGDWWHTRTGGRSVYVGSRSSEVRCIAYEKGVQTPEAGFPDWLRVEARVRPSKSARKRFLATLEPDHVWGWSTVSAEFLEFVIGSDTLQAKRLDIPHTAPAGTDRALHFMAKQYGGHIRRKVAELGSWDAFNEYLREVVARRA